MRNYVRANETRLTVSFTPQLRAKKRKLNSLTAQSPYISRTEAVPRSPFVQTTLPPPPYPDKFPNFDGKTEPNFLIVSRPIPDVSISMWREIRARNVSYFMTLTIASDFLFYRTCMFVRIFLVVFSTGGHFFSFSSQRNQQFRFRFFFRSFFLNDRNWQEGGWEISNSWPWQVSVYFDGKHSLSGVPLE